MTVGLGCRAPAAVGQPESSPRTADRRWLWLLTVERGFYPWQAWDTATATGAALQWRAPTGSAVAALGLFEPNAAASRH
jgi:hypothetical protein